MHLEHFVSFVQHQDLHAAVRQHALALPVLQLAVRAYHHLLLDAGPPAAALNVSLTALAQRGELPANNLASRIWMLGWFGR